MALTTNAEKELLSALTWLLRVSEGGEYDHKDTILAHDNAQRVVDYYSANVTEEEDTEDDD